MNIYTRQFHTEWGDLALLAMVVAMLIGGSACSTAGGFKGLRMGIIWNAFLKELRRLGRPESAVITQKYHHIKDIILDDGAMRSAMLIVLSYILMFTITTVHGVMWRYPLIDAAFEAASACGNVGLSIGLTSPTTPWPLKVNLIITMWLARLEFMSIFALIATVFTKVRQWKK